MPTLVLDTNTIANALPPGITVQHELAAGGQGVVFLGAVGGVPAAIKIYGSAGGTFDTRIDREIQALRAISSPYIVGLLSAAEISVAGHRLWMMATRLVEGEPLDKVLARGPLNSDAVTSVAACAASAIGTLWDNHQIVHRDFKPSNIILRPDGTACVIDLGVARHTAAPTLTGLGLSWGTVGYLSPEQFRAQKQLTCKSDMYGLGVVLLECLLGRHPTGRDQLVLMSSGFEAALPQGAAGYRNESVIRAMLNPSAIRRPAPAALLSALR